MITSVRSLLNVASATAEWTVTQASAAIRRFVTPNGHVTPEIPGKYRARDESIHGFLAETDMLPVLRRFVCTQWIAPNPTQTWVVLEEQRIHSRIADLVIVRLDTQALAARHEGGWLRPLRLTELRVITALRGDRPTGLDAIARKAGLEPGNVSRVLRGLATEGLVIREDASYRRLAPARALAQRVVSFEAKRAEPRRALSQARAHRPWADETYVAFDARFAERFTALTDQYVRAGVGLIEVRPDKPRVRLRSRVRRRANRLEAALMGEQALAGVLGLPGGDRPERRLPHGPLLADDSDPIVTGADSTWVKDLRWRRTE